VDASVLLRPVLRLLPSLSLPALTRLCVSFFVSRDVKLHSVLLGWIGFLTEPCVSPQVFHGSMRLSGCGRVATTARGVEPSRKCSKPGSLKPGDALESEDMVKLTERS